MVDFRRIGNVTYYEYTVATIDYSLETDAFTVARADVYSPDHPHHLSLIVVINERQLGEERIFLHDAIVSARLILEQLVIDNQNVVALLATNATWVFNIRGQRIR